MFHSIISYGVHLWGNSSKAKEIFLLQKKGLRRIVNASMTTSCKPVFKRLGILTLPSLYIYEVLKYTKRYEKKFICNKDIHEHNTRKKNDMHPNKQLLSISQNDLYHVGPIFFNVLSRELKQLPYIKFKKQLKSKLVKCCFYNIDDYLRYGINFIQN